jgi:protein-tyrosine phosphatase
VEGSRFRVLETGVVSAARVQRLANEMIAFVCSGNTCRSPMAEALAKAYLAEKLGCTVEQLDEHGFTIVSAGLAASPGAPASENARSAVHNFGADLGDHAATRLTTQLALAADRLYVMTRDHLDMIRALWPAAATRASRLCGDRDVSDPFGGPLVEYERCAAQIADAVKSVVDEWLSAKPSAGDGR